ncbi:MAG: shikimate kinase [Cyclobacteriaceae bacterium]
MKLFLVGLPGSGKSTLGKQLAQSLSLPFIDLDEAIEEQTRQPIRDTFAQRGEAFFRQLEQQTLQSIIHQQPSFVMATGGGAPCFSDNMDIMNQAGTTLFVDTPVSIIAERMLREGIAVRPLLQQLDANNFEQAYLEKFAYRLPHYQQAVITVSPKDALHALVAKLKS